MKCAIMQPTYMPWAGYFNLIASVDTFVFLDDVQFDRRSWQSRNRIFDGGKVAWLTCPVQKVSRDTLINKIALVEQSQWRALHKKKVQLNYCNAPFFDDVRPILNTLETLDTTSLSENNQAIITHLCELLGIKTKMISASEINTGGHRSTHLLNICKAIDASIYVSPQGSRDYLMEDKVFANSSVALAFQEYEPQSYIQKHAQKHAQKDSDDFVSHLSMIDVIANIGLNAASTYISRQVECTL